MRILVIRFSSAGDIVCTTLAMRRLRERFPDAIVEFLTTRGFAGLLSTNVDIDRLHTLEDHATLRQTIKLSRSLWTDPYDVVVDLHNSLRSRVARRVLRAKRRLVIRKRMLRRLRRLESHSESPVPLRYLQVLAPLGVSQEDGPLCFPVDNLHPTMTGPLGSSYVTIAPGARHATKRWPAERFAEAACTIARSQGYSGIAVIGGSDEQKTCEEAEIRVREFAPEISIDNLCGRTTWPETARVIAGASILLTNDSVAGHLAAAVDTPVVSLFGSTVPEFGFAPHTDAGRVVEGPDLPCRPCTRIGRSTCPEGHFRCMLGIQVGDVVESGLKLISEAAQDQD